MTLSTRIVALAGAIGLDVKLLTANQGVLSTLSTTAKDNLVAAINELYITSGAAAVIDDTAGSGDTDLTWSADKIAATIEAAKLAVKNELVDGAGAALDTLAELAAALGNDADFASTVTTSLGNRLRFDAPQTLSPAQQAQACANLGIGDFEADLAGLYAASKV